MSDEHLFDAGLRDAYTRAVDARSAPDRAACPSADALLALVRRDGPEASRLETLDHVMSCAECRREFELLRSIERAGGADMRRTVEGLRWRRAASIALAASAVLAISLGPGRRLWHDDDPVVRGDGSGVVLVAPAPAASAALAPAITFVWRPVPAARSYVVELLAPDGGVAFTRETPDTSLTLPAATDLRAGDYRWWVTARTEDGARVRSEARALTLHTP